MSNLFIVRSPLQLINSLEAIEYFQLTQNILVLIYNNTTNTNTQMDNLISLYKWKTIIKVNEKQKRSKYLEYIKFVKFLKQESYHYLFFSNLGSIHKLILANIKRKRTIYLDDGVETITRYNTIFKPQKLNQFKLRQIRFLLAGLKIKIDEKIDLFTYFDLKPLKNSQIIKNTLSNFQKKYLKESQKDENIYFIGQPLVKTNLLKEDDYFYYLEHILSIYSQKIIYIPHRTEIISKRLHSYISEKFEIRDINMPIELYFLQNAIYPNHIISFMTTAFFTLQKLYINTTLSYIYIPTNKILERQQDVAGAYKFINNLNIHKIEVK
jgi:hypothetical protein